MCADTPQCRVWREVALESSGVVHLRDDVDICDCHSRAEHVPAITAGAARLLLQAAEPSCNPVSVPGVDRLFVVAEGRAQIVENAQVVEWMQVACDRKCHRSDACTVHRGARQQGRLWMYLVEVLDDGQGLRNRGVFDNESGYQALRVDREVLGL